MKTNAMTAPGNSMATSLLTLLAPIAWGTTYVTVTELLPDGRPLLVAAMRVLPAGVLLVVVSGMLTGRWPGPADWPRVLILSTFNFVVFFPLLIVAVYRLPGGVAAAAGGLQPLLVALIGWAMFRARPRRPDLVVGVAAAVGVAMVVLRRDAGIDPLGVVAAVVANLSFATGVVLTKRWPPAANRVADAGWQLLVAAVVLVPLAAFVEGRPPVPTPTNIAGFAYLSLAATGAAFAVWFNGIRRLPSAAPPLLGLAVPVTGATLGWVVLGESLSVVQLVGFVVVVAAISYGATVGARPTQRHEPARRHEPGRHVRPGRDSLAGREPCIATTVRHPAIGHACRRCEGEGAEGGRRERDRLRGR